MSQVVDLDDLIDQDDCDIQVFIPGPPGPPIVDVGSILAPIVITDTIPAPVNRRQRTFISSIGNVIQPTIPNPADNGAWEHYIVWVGPNLVKLNDASNIKLSGLWVGTADSMLYLQWDGNTRYLEGGRNEI